MRSLVESLYEIKFDLCISNWDPLLHVQLWCISPNMLSLLDTRHRYRRRTVPDVSWLCCFTTTAPVRMEECSKLQGKEAEKNENKQFTYKRIDVFLFDLNIKYHCCTLKVGLYFQTYIGVFLSVKIFHSYPF